MKKRRGHGEGSIYQLPDGRWCGAVSVGWKKGEAGQPVWKRQIVYGASRNKVQQKVTATLRDQQRGLPIDRGKQTVGQFMTHWLENTVKPSTRPKTYRSYEQMARNHIIKAKPADEWKAKKLDDVPGLGNVTLSKLGLQRVQQFMNDKLQAGNSPTLVRYLRTVLRVALNHAVKDDLIARNPAALAMPPRVEKREIEPFTPEQAVQFLKAAQGHPFEALFTVGLAVGLRSGEVSGLRWPDVDLDHGVVTVRYALQRQTGKGLVLVPPKSDSGRRTIELPAVCVEALKAHQQRQLAARTWAGSAWKETGHVFTSSIGTPIDDRRILREFTTLVETAKLPRQRFHDLRHACISLLAAQGISLKVIADIVGHSDIRLTQNVYQHVFQPAKRDAADRMNDVLTGFATSFATETAPKRIN